MNRGGHTSAKKAAVPKNNHHGVTEEKRGGVSLVEIRNAIRSVIERQENVFRQLSTIDERFALDDVTAWGKQPAADGAQLRSARSTKSFRIGSARMGMTTTGSSSVAAAAAAAAARQRKASFRRSATANPSLDAWDINGKLRELELIRATNMARALQRSQSLVPRLKSLEASPGNRRMSGTTLHASPLLAAHNDGRGPRRESPSPQPEVNHPRQPAPKAASKSHHHVASVHGPSGGGGGGRTYTAGAARRRITASRVQARTPKRIGVQYAEMMLVQQQVQSTPPQNKTHVTVPRTAPLHTAPQHPANPSLKQSSGVVSKPRWHR